MLCINMSKTWHAIACMSAHFKSINLRCYTVRGCEMDHMRSPWCQLHCTALRTRLFSLTNKPALHTVYDVMIFQDRYYGELCRSENDWIDRVVSFVRTRRCGESIPHLPSNYPTNQPHCCVEWLDVYRLWSKKQSTRINRQQGMTCIRDICASIGHYERHYNLLLLHHITTRCVFKLLSIHNHPFFSSLINSSRIRCYMSHEPC